MSSAAVVVSPHTIESLRQVSTATLSMVLIKRGVRSSWMRGPVPLQPITQRVAGPAFTIRFVQGKVTNGASVYGLYPPDEAMLKEYEHWCATSSQN